MLRRMDIEQHLIAKLDPSLTRDMYDTSTGCTVISCAENSHHRIVLEIWRALEASPRTIP